MYAALWSVFLFLSGKENYGLRNPEKEIQGNKDDFCSCSCHHCWCRCWYCISHCLSWKALCWMLPPMYVVSPRITGRNLKPGGEMSKWMKLYERSMQGSNPIVPWGRGVWRRRPRGQKLPILTPSMWQSMPSGWQSLKQKKKYLPQYSQMVIVFSILPNRWTAQTRTLLVRTVYTMMLVSLCSLPHTRCTWRFSHVT